MDFQSPLNKIRTSESKDKFEGSCKNIFMYNLPQLFRERN